MYCTGWSVVITVQSFIVLQTSIRVAQCSCTLHSILRQCLWHLRDRRHCQIQGWKWKKCRYDTSFLPRTSLFFLLLLFFPSSPPFASWRSPAQIQLESLWKHMSPPSAGPESAKCRSTPWVKNDAIMTIVIALLHKLSHNHAMYCGSYTGPVTYRYGLSRKRRAVGFPWHTVPYLPSSSPGQIWCLLRGFTVLLFGSILRHFGRFWCLHSSNESIWFNRQYRRYDPAIKHEPTNFMALNIVSSLFVC